jgi:hypothetical protein
MPSALITVSLETSIVHAFCLERLAQGANTSQLCSAVFELVSRRRRSNASCTRLLLPPENTTVYALHLVELAAAWEKN